MPNLMLDYESPRRRMAAALAGYMRGEIDNFGLNDAVFASAGRDPSLLPIALTLWGAYDDVKRHTVRSNYAGWQALRRTLAFLLADEPAPRKRLRRADRSDVWPFQSWADLRRATPALLAVPLPTFDPAVHGQPIRGRSKIAGLYMMWAVIGLVLLGAAAVKVAVEMRWM